MAKRLQRAGQSSGPAAMAVVAERPVRGNGGADPRGWARTWAQARARPLLTVARSAEPAVGPASVVARVWRASACAVAAGMAAPRAEHGDHAQMQKPCRARFLKRPKNSPQGFDC